MAKRIIFFIFCTFSSLTYAQHAHRPYHKIVKKTERTFKRVDKQSRRISISGHTQKSPLRVSPTKVNENDLSRFPATPDKFWQQEWIATMNPALGRPTPEVLLDEMIRQNEPALNRRAMPGTSKTTWTSRGPNNLAGRTRALAIDPTVTTGKKSLGWCCNRRFMV